MTHFPSLPSNFASLDEALFITVSSAGAAGPTFGVNSHTEGERSLILDCDDSSENLITSFSKFYPGKDCRVVVVVTDTISPKAKLVAFLALETGFRVFLVVEDLSDYVTPDILRLANSGIVVLNNELFDAEVKLQMMAGSPS